MAKSLRRVAGEAPLPNFDLNARRAALRSQPPVLLFSSKRLERC